MAKLKDIVNFLNSELRITDIKDYSNNGLQVEGRQEVKKIGFAGDACLESFKRAKDANCDMIIVHHGLFWSETELISAAHGQRINFLAKNDISLYGVHAPLDNHPTLGNNAQLMNLLGIKKVAPFGLHQDVYWGYQGILSKEMAFNDFLKLVNQKLSTDSKVLHFGKEKIKTVGVASGGCDFAIAEAAEKGIDCILIGEIKHRSYHDAKDRQVNVIAAGHYKTERFGVLALMPLLHKKFKVKTEFFEIPTGF